MTTNDNEFARYLASFIVDREEDIMGFDDHIVRSALEELIKEFMETLP
jgi:hypothetical protein